MGSYFCAAAKCGVSQSFDKSLQGRFMADAHGHDQTDVIVVNVSRDVVLDRLEKRFDFLRDFADSNHKTSMLINTAYHNTNRHVRLLLFKQR
jgi:hypothetical protein